MMKKTKNKIITKRIVLSIITILWMIIIFLFSNSNGSNSSKTSGIIVGKVVPIIEKVTGHDLTEIEIENYVSYPIRKIAHFSEYFILGLLVILTLYSYGISKNIVILSFLICILYSLSDEIHQLFICDRNGNIIDVLVDSIGSLCGINLIKHYKIKN